MTQRISGVVHGWRALWDPLRWPFLRILHFLWREPLRVMKFDDLMGNEINHPDDFDYLVYVQVPPKLLSGVLCDKSES